MAEKLKNKFDNVSTAERAGKIYRDFNILGAVALGGAAVLAPPLLAAPLSVLAGLNVLQAGGGEWYRRYAKKKRIRKRIQKQLKNS